jgi:hypothetical protein
MIEQVMCSWIPKRRMQPAELWYGIAKVPSGTLRDARDAESIQRAIQQRLPIRMRVPIVIMDGEPSETPKLFGPHDVVTHVRENLGLIATHMWEPLRLS